MDISTGHSHPGVHNLVLNSIPDRQAMVQNTGDSRKRHCNTEGKVFECRAKTRSQVAITKYGIIYCLGCSQMNCSSCYQDTAEGYHPNPFCTSCQCSMLKISAASAVVQRWERVKLKNPSLLLKKGGKSGCNPDHFGLPDYGAIKSVIQPTEVQDSSNFRRAAEEKSEDDKRQPSKVQSW